MQLLIASMAMAMALVSGCSGAEKGKPTAEPHREASKVVSAETSSEGGAPGSVAGGYRGFDRNTYPGDRGMQALRGTFSFTGYWITSPPGARTNSWLGKREVLKQQGWGFLVLANGRLDAEILRSQKHGISAEALGKQDAARDLANAKAEGFSPGTILFLDQEEGGRLLPEQAAYLLAWTEAVAASGYKPGVYASGQLVEDDPGVMIDTVRDIRDRVKKNKLHEVAIFDAQDACPPAPGCTVNARPISEASEPDLVAWQYSQSPRRPAITKACAATYAADGNCYVASAPGIFLDMDLATSPDPSHGR